jgi:DNA invertase Pin-like site-specific DNA recombinase
MTKKNALALERVSTDKQDLEKQGEENEEVRQEHGLNVVGTLRLQGVSGTAMLTHSQVQQILRELQQPHISGLICPSVDRLFRPKHGSDFAIGNYFQNAGKLLWTKYDGVLDLATDEGWGRFMEAGVSAGKELRRIRSRTMAGKRSKRKMGRNVNGSATLPHGLCYHRIADAAGKTIDCKWFYDDDELAKVREAYRLLFEDRHNLSEIERAVGWSRGRIRTLSNPVWRGTRIGAPMGSETEPFEYKLPLDPVLTPDRWALAQTLLAKRTTWTKATRDQRFLGGGLLFCDCGRRYYSHCDTRRGQHDEYYCSSKHPRGPGCGSARLRREIVDRAIERIVSERLTDVTFLAKVFARVERPVAPDLDKRERELARLAARRQKWITQFDSDRITQKEFEEKMDAVQKATREVEAQMPVAPPPALNQRAAVAGLVRWALRFPKIDDFNQKRTELRRVVRRIPVIDGAAPSFEVCGSFLGEFAHTNSAQPSKSPCSRQCPSPESRFRLRYRPRSCASCAAHSARLAPAPQYARAAPCGRYR